MLRRSLQEGHLVHRATLFGGLLLLLLAATGRSADMANVRLLELQRAGEVTYFRIEIDAPPGLKLPELYRATGETLARRVGQLPRLRAEDRRAEVYFRSPVEPGDTLCFVGRLQEDRKPKDWVL